MFKKTSIRLELAIDLKVLCGYNSLMLAGWFIKCSLSTFAHQFTKKKEAKKKSNNSSKFYQKDNEYKSKGVAGRCNLRL